MTAKIYVASKDIAGPFQHSYFVYDPDGNPDSGDERVIRGGTTRVDGSLSGPYLMEVDRPIAESRDSLSDGKISPSDPNADPYSDRYYTTVASGDVNDVLSIWNNMADRARSLGAEVTDPWAGDANITVPPNTPAYILPEDGYNAFHDNCNTLTRTVGEAGGIDVLSNLPKIGGDTGAGVRDSVRNYMGIDSKFTPIGDGTTPLDPSIKAIFDQGGNDAYTLNPSVFPDGKTINIFEDSNSSTLDKIVLQGVDPNDVRLVRTPNGDLLVYLEGRFSPVARIHGQFDEAGNPKMNTLWAEPPGGGAPVVVPLNNPDDFPLYVPDTPPSWVPQSQSPLTNTPGIGPINFQSLGRTDPLVIDLDNDGLELVSAVNSGVRFDFSGDGFATATGWVGADDGFLVRDLDADGLIENVGEMFGAPHSLTYIVGSDWEAFMNEENGFAKLAALDTNANDAAWGELKVWKDTNQDGVSQATELHTLSTLGIAGIDTGGYQFAPYYGNGVWGRVPRREARSRATAERVRQILLKPSLIYRADGAAIAHSVAANDNRCFGKRSHPRRAERMAA